MTSNAPTFQSLATVIEGGQLPQDTQRDCILIGVEAIVAKTPSKFATIAKQFSQNLLETRYVHVHHQYLHDNLEEIKFLICKNNKAFHFKGNQYKGFVISGKSASVNIRKKAIDETELQHKEELSSLIEQGMIRLYEDDKLILTKAQKDFTLNDILLIHDMPDAKTDQVYLGNQVYSPFVPIQKSIIMLVPFKPLKPQCMDFVKSSILHTYLDESPLLSKIIQKQTFYKNSVLRGIYFIDQGQVEVPSGRIIARGWTCYAKCRLSGVGWKFKPIPFIRFLAKNPSIWKQFISDVTLNEGYPFNIIHILGLTDDDDFTSSAEWKSLGKRKLGGKNSRLPKLNHLQSQSFDHQKYIQMERLRHYDERLDDIFTYKQDLLTRKLKGIVHGKFQPIFRSQEADKQLQQKKKIIDRMSSKRSMILNKKFTQPELGSQNHPGENVLIISVLKRLQSIADMEENNTTSRDEPFFLHSQSRSPNRGYLIGGTQRKGNVTITPMQLYERTKSLKKKSNRYSRF